MNTSTLIEGDTVTIKLNSRVYSLDTAYATAYVHLDTMWFLFNGDPAVEIIVSATRKQPTTDLDLFAKQFLNELISITNYFSQFERNKDVINLILQRALFSASPQTAADAQRQEVEHILTEVNEHAPQQ